MAQVDHLASILERSQGTLDERIRAAHELAELGDPRAVAHESVAIAGGAFLGGDPPRSISLPAFAIDRYPVTVAAFAAFISAGGYAAREHWTHAGWSWRTQERIERPRFWNEEEWRTYLVPNHPVVGISFYEAEAYAAFRGARLPTEAEWEKAARGTDGRHYPWGPDWIDDACGMRGIGPRSTIPIGVFPKGQSVYGVRDLVGCIWQWTTSPFRGWGGDGEDDEPSASPEDGPDARKTTCGGAWNTQRWSVSCLGRNGFPCSARFSNLGFRCVIDPR